LRCNTLQPAAADAHRAPGFDRNQSTPRSLDHALLTEEASMQSGGLSRMRLARMGEVMRNHVERGEAAGLVGLVARRDAVHIEVIGVEDIASRTPMRRDSLFRIASMTKPILAAAAMILVEEARIALDDPVERWLPELKDRRVLRAIDSQLDDTFPAERPITLRDLLTFRLGLGAVMAPPGTYPIQAAMSELGLAPGPGPLPFTPDEYMARIARLPLAHQPGEKWMYHTGIDILGVLIARVAGMPLPRLLQQRMFDPLGMKDTGFSVPEESIDRLTTCYARNESNGKLEVWDPARSGSYARPPVFPNALVSSADEYLAFCRMLASKGRGGGNRILARPTVELMMSDQLSPAQKAQSPFFPGFWDNKGWGFGGAVITCRDGIALSPGSYGWNGGFGTSFLVDPAEDMIVILLIQRLMRGPNDVAINRDFLTLAYRAIDD
jgi:CubicO group peptidase (beta-lactamase class C family)